MIVSELIGEMKEDFGLQDIKIDTKIFKEGKHFYDIGVNPWSLDKDNKATIELADYLYLAILADVSIDQIKKKIAHELGHIKSYIKHPRLVKALTLLSYPCHYHSSADEETREKIEPWIYLLDATSLPIYLVVEGLADLEARRAGYNVNG